MKKLLLTLVVAGMCFGMVGCAKMPLRGDYVQEKAPPQISADSEHGIVSVSYTHLTLPTT